jgi:flagellar biosynthesis protein FlhB
VLGSAAAAQLGRWIANAASSADGLALASTSAAASAAPAGSAGPAAASAGFPASTSVDAFSPLPFALMGRAVLELALPLLGAVAIAAVIVHLAQTRSVWMPRRSLPGAPSLPPRRVSRASLDLLGAVAVGGVALAWLWTTAPQLAALFHSPRSAGLALLSLVAALAIAWVTLGILDALVRHIQLATGLAMTRDEKREDDRLAAADPRWRTQRLSILRGGGLSSAVARSAVVIVGDDTAIAIAWDAVRQPIPLRVATGRRARAMQLIGLARRHRVAVHRDADLAARLVEHEGPVPEAEWARLAELVAAVRR